MTESSTITTAKFSFKACVTEAWQSLRDHWFQLAVAAYLRDLIAIITFGLTFCIVEPWTDWSLLIALAAGLFVAAGLHCGFLKLCFNLYETKKICWKDLFSQFGAAADMLIATICMYCAVAMGFLCLIIPGIFLMVRFSLYGTVLIDKKIDAEKAISESYRMLKGYGIYAAGFMLILFIGQTLLRWWSCGFEALLVLCLWGLYKHIGAQEESS
jgi:hypothetical protein